MKHHKHIFKNDIQACITSYTQSLTIGHPFSLIKVEDRKSDIVPFLVSVQHAVYFLLSEEVAMDMIKVLMLFTLMSPHPSSTFLLLLGLEDLDLLPLLLLLDLLRSRLLDRLRSRLLERLQGSRTGNRINCAKNDLSTTDM